LYFFFYFKKINFNYQLIKIKSRRRWCSMEMGYSLYITW